ncbi:pseudaminic acid cytidylyltransferase [Paludibacterium yongneupense]|uniref:pseudaminic acid cytidylyltransferase n=1 Tax=Paludibacterium yongneupense TaxID=400061 RepID=UPI000688B34F|nr:pseudaminic acid cytidylyltransferase [Paludibacterium yongneupense]
MRVAIIPARGGSKRIPRKNILPFAGIPMIAHSILCAKKTGVFDRIIVSTDDAEISGVAKRFGAEVPFIRPPELSDDYTGTVEVVAHAVDWLRRQGEIPEQVCCIYATAPFVGADDICRAGTLLETGGWAYVFAATTYAYPVFRSFSQTADGGLSMVFPEHYTSRSQDLPEVLHDAGQFYWGRAEAWLEKVRIFGDHSTVVTIPRWRVQDIDTAEDWAQAEAMASYLLPHAGGVAAKIHPMDTRND